MRILDLYCKEGGASMGYRLAFPDAEIVGIDIEPQPLYPFMFMRADAIACLDNRPFLDSFDLIHASPPCHDKSTLKALQPAHGTRLDASGDHRQVEGAVGAVGGRERAWRRGGYGWFVHGAVWFVVRAEGAPSPSVRFVVHDPVVAVPPPRAGDALGRVRHRWRRADDPRLQGDTCASPRGHGDRLDVSCGDGSSVAPGVLQVHRRAVRVFAGGGFVSTPTRDPRDEFSSLVWSPRPAWVLEAACRGLDPRLFYPERGGDTTQAKAVCASCPVSAQCLEQAYRDDEPGVWGGTSAKQRREQGAGGQRGPRRPRPINHGTLGGYTTHRRRGEEACDGCKSALAQYIAEKRAS